jgi:acyl-CoA thioester hydrolase
MHAQSLPTVTHTAPTQPFRYFVRVRYQDCDAQHVVFNARYGDFVDLAVTEFLKASFPDRDPNDGSFEMQVVRQLIEWTGPARFDDVLEIEVAPKRYGTTSFVIAFELRRPGEPTIVTAECTYVVVDKATWKKRPLTAIEREFLASGAADKVVDHAGHFPITLPPTDPRPSR